MSGNGREIEWAIIDKGPFQLHPSLRHLQVRENRYIRYTGICSDIGIGDMYNSKISIY